MADKFIVISKNTSFNGTLTADEVIVEGVVEGDINASDAVFIKSGAIIKGSIRTEKLFFEEGGEHVGMVFLDRDPVSEKQAAESQATVSHTEDQSDDRQQANSNPARSKAEQKDDTKRLW